MSTGTIKTILDLLFGQSVRLYMLYLSYSLNENKFKIHWQRFHWKRLPEKSTLALISVKQQT